MHRAAWGASAHVPSTEFTMTAMAHYHVVKEKSRHTHTQEKRKKGRKKDRRVFLSFALVIWPRDVTSSTLNQYNRSILLYLQHLLSPTQKGENWMEEQVDVTDSYGLYHTVSVRRAWWVHKTGNRTLNTYTTVQSFPVYITVGGVGYKEDGLHEDANDRQRKKKGSKWRCFPATLSLSWILLCVSLSFLYIGRITCSQRKEFPPT